MGRGSLKMLQKRPKLKVIIYTFGRSRELRIGGHEKPSGDLGSQFKNSRDL